VTISARGNPEPSHQENCYYFVLCYSCERCSPENGDFFDPPEELASFTDHLNYQQASDVAKAHEHEYGLDHDIRIIQFDTGRLQELLDI